MYVCDDICGNLFSTQAGTGGEPDYSLCFPPPSRHGRRGEKLPHGPNGRAACQLPHRDVRPMPRGDRISAGSDESHSAR